MHAATTIRIFFYYLWSNSVKKTFWYSVCNFNDKQKERIRWRWSAAWQNDDADACENVGAVGIVHSFHRYLLACILMWSFIVVSVYVHTSNIFRKITIKTATRSVLRNALPLFDCVLLRKKGYNVRKVMLWQMAMAVRFMFYKIHILYASWKFEAGNKRCGGSGGGW